MKEFMGYGLVLRVQVGYLLIKVEKVLIGKEPSIIEILGHC